jgi:hypothetical protein
MIHEPKQSQVAEAIFVKHGSSTAGETFAAIQFAFNIVYVIESILKIMTLSWNEYFGHVANKFDFFVSWVLFLISFSAKPHQADGDASHPSHKILVYRCPRSGFIKGIEKEFACRNFTRI